MLPLTHSRSLWVPLRFFPDHDPKTRYPLLNGFYLLKKSQPEWLGKHDFFLSRYNLDNLRAYDWWLSFDVKPEAAIGEEYQQAKRKIDHWLFATSVLCPSHNMFPPIFLIEQGTETQPAWIRRIVGMDEEEHFYLPRVFGLNRLRLNDAQEAAKLVATLEQLLIQRRPTFNIAGSFWTVSFKQSLLEVCLLLSVMGLEAFLGSYQEKPFLQRLGCVVNLREQCYSHKPHYEGKSKFTFEEVIRSTYVSRGQIAHGGEVSPSFLERLETTLGEKALVERASGDRVEILEILMEASRLLLQKLLLLVIRDPKYSFLVEDGKSKDQRFKALITSGGKLYN